MEPGQRLGPYEVVALLGAGGMGEVWRARDTRLGREVAVKVLPAALPADPDRVRRFEVEARAAAALNHANILALHDVGDVGGAPYLVTELLEGETLRAAIGQGPLSPRKAVDVALQLAKGLEAAHEKGIVHRDLKPENVFLTRDGTVKILDFGLARLARTEGPGLSEATTQAHLTREGMVVGTLGYMAPEQVRGQSVDHRADIFAFGCLLYEMLSGQAPFRRQSAADTLSAILHEDPEDLQRVAASVPPAISAIVGRCLEKRPADRLSSAHDLSLALQTVSAAGVSAASPRRRTGLSVPRRAVAWAAGAVVLALMASGGAAVWRSRRAPALDSAASRVAVLPFENRTGDATLDPIGLMVADGIARSLVQHLGLQVVSGPMVLDAWQDTRGAGTRSGSAESLRVVAERLGASVVVSGDYYAVGDAVTFRPRLIDAREQRDLATLEPVTAPRDSHADALERVQQQVLGSAALLFKGLGSAAAGVPSESPDEGLTGPVPTYEAYREFLAGVDSFSTNPREAVRHLERFEQLYPHGALVVPWLAFSYMGLGEFEKAERLIEKVRGRVAEPGEGLLVDFFSASLAGRLVDAHAAMQSLHRLEPRHLQTANVAAMAAMWLGRPREAIAALSDVDVTPWSSTPSGAMWMRRMAQADHMLGRYDDERNVGLRAGAAAPSAPWPLLIQARALAALGRVEDLSALIDGSLRTLPATAAPTPGHIMVAAAGELRAHGHREASVPIADRALRWLDGLDPRVQGSAPMRRVRRDALGLLGRWDDAAALCAKLAAESPADIDAQSALGVAAARRGDRATARRADDALLRLDRPYVRGEHTYARARIAAALGDAERTVSLLQQGFAEGQAFLWQTHGDLAFESVRGNRPFDQVAALDQSALDRPASTGPAPPASR